MIVYGSIGRGAMFMRYIVIVYGSIGRGVIVYGSIGNVHEIHCDCVW